MKVATALPLMAALASTTIADGQSGPFRLQLSSKNQAYDSKYVSTCRTGAMISMFCINTTAQGFYLNTTSQPTSGLLTYNVPMNNQNMSYAMRIVPSLNSNVAVPSLSVGPSRDAPYVEFDKENFLYLAGGIDDAKMPTMPPAGQGNLYRWVACKVPFVYGGVIDTLAWVVGSAKAQNPTCAEVKVKRVQ